MYNIPIGFASIMLFSTAVWRIWVWVSVFGWNHKKPKYVDTYEKQENVFWVAEYPGIGDDPRYPDYSS